MNFYSVLFFMLYIGHFVNPDVFLDLLGWLGFSPWTSELTYFCVEYAPAQLLILYLNSIWLTLWFMSKKFFFWIFSVQIYIFTVLPNLHTFVWVIMVGPNGGLGPLSLLKFSPFIHYTTSLDLLNFQGSGFCTYGQFSKFVFYILLLC